MENSFGLEEFIDKSIRVSIEHGYHPTVFMEMRTRHGTAGAIDRLVRSGDIQSGFKRLRELGLLEWSIENAVLKFPDDFSTEIRDAAEWRLSQAQ